MSSPTERRQPERGKLERRARLGRGARGELAAAVWLMVHGYRILARRHRTPYGEVDIVAVRGHRIAFVEVKRRLSLADAQAALTPHQAARIGRAADHWLARHPRYGAHEVGLDAILVVPWHLPRHLPNALDAP